MASTFSTNLALELIGTGDQAGTWGITTNTNLGTLIEQAISGYVTQAVATGTDTTITIPDGATGVARNMYIELTGTGGTNTNLIVPSNKKLYFIFNNSTGAVTVKVSGQTGISVPAGKKMVLVSNGTDIVNAANYVADFGSNSATITQLTSTSATITNLTLTSLVLSNLSIASANVTTLTSASATITNLLATSLTVSGNTFLATSSGNVGIGTSSPGAKLDVNGNVHARGASFPAFKFADSSGNAEAEIYYGISSNDLNLVSNQSGGVINLQTGGGVKATLDASGNLGLGTSSPAAKLHVLGSNLVGIFAGTNANTVYTEYRYNSTTVAGYIGNGSSILSAAADSDFIIRSEGALKFLTNGNNLRATIDSSGNLGLGVTPSAWQSSTYAVEVGPSSSLSNIGTTTGVTLGANVYYNSAWKYKLTDEKSTLYTQFNGVHSWSTAASGTAGNTISFTQAMTLDASGQLGLGTTTPGSFGKFAVVGTSTGTLCAIRDEGTPSGNTFVVSSNANGSAIVVNSSGNVLFGKNISVGGATPTTSGTGITFPATQSASSNANTLDDYEEGTWTPTLRFGGSSTGITYNTSEGGSEGKYVKIGNTVIAWFSINLSNKGAGSGNADVQGLPFNTGNVYYNEMGGYINYYLSFNNLKGAPTAYVSNGPTMAFYQPNANSGSIGNGASALAYADFNNDSRIWGTVIYSV